MTRIAFALLAAAFIAGGATSSLAATFSRGKNGAIITCTQSDCVAQCIKNGSRASACPQVCFKLINDRKASGECK